MAAPQIKTPLVRCWTQMKGTIERCFHGQHNAIFKESTFCTLGIMLLNRSLTELPGAFEMMSCAPMVSVVDQNESLRKPA